jgi:hypothetical protein
MKLGETKTQHWRDVCQHWPRNTSQILRQHTKESGCLSLRRWWTFSAPAVKLFCKSLRIKHNGKLFSLEYTDIPTVFHATSCRSLLYCCGQIDLWVLDRFCINTIPAQADGAAVEAVTFDYADSISPRKTRQTDMQSWTSQWDVLHSRQSVKIT